MEDYRPVQKMMDYASSRLMEEGYDPYYLYRQKNTVGNLENVGYALPGHWGAYNIYIMEEIQNILACGGGAVSKVVKPGGLERIYNFKYPYEYLDRFSDILDRKQQLSALLSGAGKEWRMVSDVKKKLDAGLISSMAERSPRELIRLSEKRYRDQIAEVADRFAGQFPRQKIILLSGPTSSG